MKKLSSWQLLPETPLPALSGRFAGVSADTLVAAGGSYFPKSLFEGGTKVVSDRIDVLDQPKGRWQTVGTLDRPIVQGASVTDALGVICVGGNDLQRGYADVFRLRWTGSRIERDRLPDLPAPATFLGAARLGTSLYVLGGAATPTATEALPGFWRLDRATKRPKWEPLPPLPGLPRIGHSMTTQAGAIYVFGGAALQRGPDGKPSRTYLRDSYRYREGEGWRRLADLPATLVAAPILAFGSDSILLFGGDDGANAARQQELKDKHPGFRKEVFAYDLAGDRWSVVPGVLPVGLVTTPAVWWKDSIIIPGGEDRPGHRPPTVLAAKTMVQEKNGAMTAATCTQTVIFRSGTNNYNTFRIPALIPTKKGTLLAFAEGRVSGGGDAGAIDMLLKRSEDGGRTWGPLQVIWTDTGNTCGNPCPVVDAATGTIHLLMTHNRGDDHEKDIHAGSSKASRTVWVADSTDDGKTWRRPREITETTKKKNWGWYATGPGVGIQLSQGPHKGRLVIPCDHSEFGIGGTRSHVIFSDDNGKSWQLGGTEMEGAGNECQVAELADGRLLLNMRNSIRERRERGISYSGDGGMTWSGFHGDPALIEPVCQAALVRAMFGTQPALLYSNPADRAKRLNMTVRVSTDDGKTWAASRSLFDGPSAYSSLTAIVPGQEYACLYERGDEKPYETITFARFNAAWLQG